MAPTKDPYLTVSCGPIPEEANAMEAPYRYLMEFDKEQIHVENAMEIVEAVILDAGTKLLNCDDYQRLNLLRRQVNEVVAVSLHCNGRRHDRLRCGQ